MGGAAVVGPAGRGPEQPNDGLSPQRTRTFDPHPTVTALNSASLRGLSFLAPQGHGPDAARNEPAMQ